MREEVFCARDICMTSERGASLRQLNLTLYSGEILGFLGSRYAGKSALFAAMLGLRPVQSGIILWDGSPSVPRQSIKRVGRRSPLVDELKIWENLALLWKKPGEQMVFGVRHVKNLIRLYLEDYHISLDIERSTSTLSQMEKLLLEIVMALRSKPRIFLVDLSGIEGTAQEYLRMRELFQRMRADNIAVVVSDYQAEIISFLADRIAILFNGRILKVLDSCEISARQLSEMTARLYHVEKSNLPGAAANGGCVLELEGLEAGLARKVSLQLYRGDFLTVVSPQLELQQILARRLLEGEQMESCPVRFQGKPVRRLCTGKDVLFLNVRMLDVLIDGLSPLENLCLGVSQKVNGFGSRRLMEAMERDFYEWYGHEGLLRQADSRSLYKKDRIAINLFRLRFFRPLVLFCDAPGVYNDVVTYNMVMDALIGMARQGSSVCVLCSDFTGRTEQMGRYIVLDGVTPEQEGCDGAL